MKDAELKLSDLTLDPHYCPVTQLSKLELLLLIYLTPPGEEKLPLIIHLLNSFFNEIIQCFSLQSPTINIISLIKFISSESLSPRIENNVRDEISKILRIFYVEAQFKTLEDLRYIATEYFNKVNQILKFLDGNLITLILGNYANFIRFIHYELESNCDRFFTTKEDIVSLIDFINEVEKNIVDSCRFIQKDSPRFYLLEDPLSFWNDLMGCVISSLTTFDHETRLSVNRLLLQDFAKSLISKEENDAKRWEKINFLKLALEKSDIPDIQSYCFFSLPQREINFQAHSEENVREIFKSHNWNIDSTKNVFSLLSSLSVHSIEALEKKRYIPCIKEYFFFIDYLLYQNGQQNKKNEFYTIMRDVYREIVQLVSRLLENQTKNAKKVLNLLIQSEHNFFEKCKAMFLSWMNVVDTNRDHFGIIKSLNDAIECRISAKNLSLSVILKRKAAFIQLLFSEFVDQEKLVWTNRNIFDFEIFLVPRRLLEIERSEKNIDRSSYEEQFIGFREKLDEFLRKYRELNMVKLKEKLKILSCPIPSLDHSIIEFITEQYLYLLKIELPINLKSNDIKVEKKLSKLCNICDSLCSILIENGKDYSASFESVLLLNSLFRFFKNFLIKKIN